MHGPIALSITFLVITARLLLFRLFLKQLKYQRHMQQMQPQIQALRAKYKDDRAEMQRQMMKLQHEQGFNPLTGCLPMFLQIPIFISLYHVLRHLARSATVCDMPGRGGSHLLTLYTFSKTETCEAAKATLFGAPLAGSLRDTQFKIEHLLGGDVTSTRVVTLVLVIISAAATLLTQILVSRAATTLPTGTAATGQRLMKVFIPISVLFSGGVLSRRRAAVLVHQLHLDLLQQLYVNKYHPHVPPAHATGPRPRAPDDSVSAHLPSTPSRAPHVGQRPQAPSGTRRDGPRRAKKRYRVKYRPGTAVHAALVLPSRSVRRSLPQVAHAA